MCPEHKPTPVPRVHRMSDVSEAWIQPRMTSTGFLPDVGVHLRGRAVVQEVSRSVWVGAVAMCCMALVALIPISVIGFDVPYYVQIIVALGCVWGAICVVVGTKWIFHEFGTSVTFDLDLQTIVVRSDGRKNHNSRRPCHWPSSSSRPQRHRGISVESRFSARNRCHCPRVVNNKRNQILCDANCKGVPAIRGLASS